ncbi:hypothetical protein PG985_008620 [Apiospora marii]|uniref:uncharacterized protein n=1 Tax=Apiospora marii TaxID=335849 RepID=UPI00312E864A
MKDPKDPIIAEKQRKHFQNKTTPPLRRTLFDSILRAKVQFEEELEDVGFNSGDAHDMTPAIRAYVMRPASHCRIPMKEVVCFADDSSYDYATVEVGTKTYLLAYSSKVMKEKCPSWRHQLVKRKKNAAKADHLRHKFTERDFKAFKLILGVAHGHAPDLSAMPLAKMHDLTIVSIKLGALNMMEDWARNFLSQLKMQFEDGKAADHHASLSTVGWPCTLRLSVEFSHREMFTVASRHFVRKCRLVRAKTSYWTFGSLSWEGTEFEMNTKDLFACIMLNHLKKREEVITAIRSLMDEKKESFGWKGTTKSFRMAANRLRNHPSEFRKRAVVAAMCRGELTGDLYTDASVDDIIAWIRDLTPKSSGTSKSSDTVAEARMVLEQVATDVDTMVQRLVDEMVFPFG